MRIRYLAVSAMAAFTLAAVPAAADPIVISNWDGYMPEDLLERFTAATGIEAELALHATNEEIMGKLTAAGGRGYDVVFVSSPFAEALNNLGLAATIDPSMIPNMQNLYPEAMELEYDPGNTYQVPYAWGTTGLCYRSDLVADAPTSWMDLLQPSEDLAGKVTMLATDRWLMAAGLLATGHSVNATDAQALAEAEAVLIDAKDTLLAYDDATFYSKLVSGEAHLVHAWDGWCNYGIAENADIRFVVPEEGSDLWVDTMVIMEASENKEAAHAFIDFILNVDNGKWVAENILYKVPNAQAMAALDPALVAQFPNMGMSPAQLMAREQMRDLGNAQKDFARVVSNIMSAE